MLKKDIFKKIIFNILYTILTINSSISYIQANDFNDNITNLENEISSYDNLGEDNLDLELNSQAAVLIDAKTGVVLYDKNMNEKLYPASITKVLTAILVLENTDLDDILTHSHNAVFNIGQGSSHIGMREGEQITIEDALYAILLASANEVCMAVAEHISGSVEAFVNLMNERLQKIGAVNSHFSNPHGFHDNDHYTTAYDMALIMKEAIKIPKFVEVISTETYTIPETNLVNEKRILNNTNRMIKPWETKFYNEKVVGGKTGFTNEAGNTLVTYAKDEDIELISVVMKAEGTSIYTDTTTLINYGLPLYKQVEIFNKDSFNTKAMVTQSFNDTTIDLQEIDIIPESSVILSLPENIDLQNIDTKVFLNSKIEAPVKVGDKVGTLSLTYNNSTISYIDLISNSDVELIPESNLIKKQKVETFVNFSVKILKYIIIFIISLLISLTILSLIIRIIRKNRRKKLRFSNYNKGYYQPKRRKR